MTLQEAPPQARVSSKGVLGESGLQEKDCSLSHSPAFLVGIPQEVRGTWRFNNSHPLTSWPRGPFPVWACFLPRVNQSCKGSRSAVSLPQVYPIVDFPLREISLASQRGIAEHSAALSPRARVLQQVSGVGVGGCGEARLLGPGWGSCWGGGPFQTRAGRRQLREGWRTGAPV